MHKNLVVFTDLDGTLLEYGTYSFKPALTALRLLKAENIPLVICTSKTRAEIEFYRKLLDNRDHFASENGGGIFIPENYFPDDFDYYIKADGYKIIRLGTDYKSLVEALNSIKSDTGLNIKSFSEMTASEISELSNLSTESARLAQTREYDEPFAVYGDENDKELIKTEITRRGFKHTEGGLFHHIMGANDKGKAVKILTRLFRRKSGDLKTVGIGDSLNDLPMLKNVDIPILVQKPNGEFDSAVRVDNLIFAEDKGPEGWNKAILNLLKGQAINKR